MPRPIVVLSVNASWNIVNFRRGLVAALQAAGYNVVAIAPEDQYSTQLAAMGVRFVPLAIDSSSLSPAKDLRLLAAYHRRLKAIRPAAFLGYTIKPNVYGSLAAHALGIPVINNVAGLGTAFLSSGWLARLVSRLYAFAFRRSATVFFQNEDDMAMFVGNGIVRAAQARLIPGSGIDLSGFTPGEARLPSGGFTFLLMGRLLWDKGIGEYVEAARLVREHVPDARFQLLGFLDAANRTAIPRNEVEGWVAEGLIDYLGHSDDVRPFIAAADCVVLPSYREGLPRVLLEGAAMAKPLIATDVPGCRSVVQEGVNGFLCEVKSGPLLADAMLRMIRLSEEERSAMAAAARRKVEQEYDECIVTSAYLEALGRALRR